MRRTCIHHSFLLLGLVAATACYAPDDEPMAAESSTTDDEDPSATDPTDTPDPTSATLTTSTTDPTTDDSADDSESSGDPDPTDASEDESSDGDGESETTGAAAAPTVVETSPADGDFGVWSDAAIVVQFDTPMDQAATQAAYQSMSLPAAFVTFSWNDAGDELTITPLVPLQYAEGDDPISLGANVYGFTITTTATSLEGLALEDDVMVAFSTLRRIEQVLERDAGMSGNVGDVQGPLGSSFFGDRSNNEPVRYAVSFDLDALATEIALVEEATFHASWFGQSGDPWTGLGVTVFQHVVFGAMDDAYDAPATGDAEGLFGTIADTDVARDAAWALEAALADLDAHDHRLQFRMRWWTESDNDGAYDSVSMDGNDLELHVTYLAP